jgi:hypothetical protein
MIILTSHLRKHFQNQKIQCCGETEFQEQNSAINNRSECSYFTELQETKNHVNVAEVIEKKCKWRILNDNENYNFLCLSKIAIYRLT